MARGGSDGPDDAPTHEDGQRSGEDSSSDHGEDNEELHALMMCDVSSDSINLDGEDFERLQPSLRIAEHATRDDSDESVERGGPHNLPSGCIELLDRRTA